jgi:hypothetical protein
MKPEIRNSKFETSSKSEAMNSKLSCFVLDISNFEFVSDFVLRISDLNEAEQVGAP